MGKEPLIRAIYLEDSKDEYEQWKDDLENALSLGRFRCSLELVGNSQGFEQALLHRPHVVICDMDLGNKTLRYEGAQLISRYKKAYPDVIFFLLTGQQAKLNDLSPHVPHPDHYFNKEYLGTQDYNDYISQIVRQLLRRYPIQHVEHDFDLKERGPAHPRAKLSSAELKSLVEQCLYGVDSGIDGLEISKVELSAIPGGFSGSGVYLMHIWTGDRRNSVPGILKISELKRARAEIDNYNRYVKWRLPYMWRVDLMGYGTCGNFGAICYSFAMGGGGVPAPVNNYLRNGSSHAVDVVLNSILCSKDQNWYAERRPSGKDARVYFAERPYYSNNPKRVAREELFVRYLKEVAQTGGINIHFEEKSFTLGDRKIPNPNSFLFGRPWGEVTTCVCHGDLNGNNVIMAGDRHDVAFIDFQNTGFHYLFRDFISFESSIRLEVRSPDQHWGDDKFLEVVNDELRLISSQWSPMPNDGTYICEASKVRQAAHQNFESESLNQYLIANTVHSLWLLEKAEKWDHFKKRRLLATIVAGLSGLE